MKTIIAMLFILVMAVSSQGCHQSIDAGELPFEEALVIRGVLQEGDTLKTLYVAKTTQYQEKYYQWYGTSSDNYQGWISDAVVSVECDGKTYTMTYRGKGNYGNDTLVVEAGRTYRLHASWNGHRAEAVTTVPYSISIDSVIVAARTLTADYGDWGRYHYTLEACIHNNMNSVFDLTVVQGVSTPSSSLFEKNDILMSNEAGSLEHVKLQITCDLSIAYDPRHLNTHTMIVQSFDEPYYDYRQSSENELSSEIAWNVTGEAIGMFIGASKPVLKTFTLE